MTTIQSDNIGFQSVDIASRASIDGLREMTVHSSALNRRGDLTLFAPVEANTSAPLRLIILLHGVYGSHWAWSRNGRAHEVLQALTTRGRVRPAILAMPSDGLFSIGSGYLPRPHEDADRWIAEEVPAAVRLLYPSAGASSIAVAGLSMGGWGALRLAAKHPGRYSAAVALSPLTCLSQIADYAPEGSYDTSAIADPHLLPLMVRQHRELPPVRIGCGRQDPLLSEVRQLHDGLLSAGITHEYAESNSRHDWDYWTQQLPHTFEFIDRHQ